MLDCSCEHNIDLNFLCVDCKVHTLYIGEYYMVHDSVWAFANLDAGMLCIACLEQRLERKLTKSDFTDFPINSSKIYFKSSLMLARLAQR